ncbi:MAG: hypothetical protein HFG53_04540 [Lachnospiraceae bacterium]|jgi:hypothetical protein|nr:hypothetical protein [Lachnospiraceae bacterium]
MPYCPKCDMEFIDGITICSDCGGPLTASKEAYDALKKKTEEEAFARMKSQYDAMTEYAKAESYQPVEQSGILEDSQILEEADTPTEAKSSRRQAPTSLYIKKSQQYDDMKSSGWAFLLTGGALLAFAVLCWLNILPLHLGIISKLAITVFGAGSLIVSLKTFQSAKTIRGQIHEEEEKSRKLTDWFLNSYTGSKLDEQLFSEFGELLPEELSLKRFGLIQDILITSYDLHDQSYVDLLTDEIYEKMFQD